MGAFFIDTCHKKVRFLAFVACFLFVLVGDYLQIPWYYRFGLAFLVVLYSRNNTRYCFFPDRIEKCRCRTSYEDLVLFPKRNGCFQSPSEKQSSLAPQEYLLASPDEINSKSCRKMYPKSFLQKIQFIEGKQFVSILFLFIGHRPQTERFLWTYCLRNRKTSFRILIGKKDPNLASYVRLLNDYHSTQYRNG